MSTLSSKIKKAKAKTNIATPVTRKFKTVDTLDNLTKYDPTSADPKEVQAFDAELSRIMASTATVMLDPRLDPRDLKRARNYHEWLTGRDFLGIKPFARQIDIGSQLNLDVCWNCSPEYYDGPDIDFKLESRTFAKKYQFMYFGVCPNCGATRSEGVRNNYVFDKIKHIGVAGQRCVVGSTIVSHCGGFHRIENYFPNAVEGENSLGDDALKLRTPSGYAAPIKFFKYMVAETFKVTLANGFTLEGTGNHPIFTNRGFVKLFDLTDDDFVAMAMSQTTYGKNTDAEFSEDDIQEAFRNNKIPDKALGASKTYLARFLRAVLSHGLITPCDKGHSYQLDKKYQNLVHDCMVLLHGLGGACSLSTDANNVCLDVPDESFWLQKNLNDVTSHSYYWTRVAQVERLEHATPIAVYDYEIPKGHVFIGNMVINHNSSKCLPGDTLIHTPDGPIELIDLVNRGSPVVRLPTTDAGARLSSEHLDFVHTIKTDHGVDIRMNAQHRMQTLEHGYIPAAYVGKGQSHIKVGMHLELPPLRTMRRQELSPSLHRRGVESYFEYVTNQFSAFARQTVAPILKNIWREPYSARRGFFDECLRNSIVHKTGYFDFRVATRHLAIAARAWIEAHGVRAFPVEGEKTAFGVDCRLFLKKFPQCMPSQILQHYWKTNHESAEWTLPPAFGVKLEPLLKRVLENSDKFKLLTFSDDAQTRLTHLYSLWSQCRHRRKLSATQLREAISILWPWRKLRWSGKEKTDFEILISFLRRGLTHRYAKITAILPGKREQVYDIEVPGHHWFIANGYNSHNSASFGHLLSYTTHRLLMTGDPAAYYSLLPGQYLTAILTASIVDQATQNLYRPLQNILIGAPWFKAFNEWARDRQHLIGLELFKIMGTFALYRFGSLDIRVLSPNRTTIRGYTAYGTGIDELGHFDTNPDKLRGSGLEIYAAVTNACATTNAAAVAMRNNGMDDVIFPVSHAISSPSAKSDPIMQLFYENEFDPHALTYIIPTWKFNPLLTYDVCKRLAPPATFMRDFGCVLTDASGNFISKLDYIYALCDNVKNAAKVVADTYVSPQRERFTIGKVVTRFQAAEGMQCGLAIDAGYNNNSFAFNVFRLEEVDTYELTAISNETDIDDAPAVKSGRGKTSSDVDDSDANMDDTVSNVRLIIEAVGEIVPTLQEPIHYNQLMRHVIIPLIEKFNVKVIVSDRWQTLKLQQDICDSYDVKWVPLTLKKPDFLKFRIAVTDRAVILPECEITYDDVTRLGRPEDFRNYPVAHFLRQCLTVRETPKTVEKGVDFSDDIFRTVVLAHAISETDELRGYLFSSNVRENRGDPTTVVTSMTKVEDTNTHVLYLSGDASKPRKTREETLPVTAVVDHSQR